MKSSATAPSQECSVSLLDMADYKPKYNQGINWAVLARNDEPKLNKGCKGCRYLDHHWHCHYMSDMGPGHSRVAMGVKTYPGGGCDLYEGKKRDKTSIRPGIMVTKGVAKKMREANRTNTGTPVGPENHDAALTLYNKGAGDSQIAASLGVTKQAVCDWRKAHGLESNHLKFRKESPT